MPTIEDLEAEIIAIDARRQVVVGLLHALRAYEAGTGGALLVSVNHKAPERQPRLGSAMADTDRVAADLMERHQKPVHTGAIAAQMHKLGHVLPEKNARNVVSARMSNNPRFVGRRGLGWWFADRPWPEHDDVSPSLPTVGAIGGASGTSTTNGVDEAEADQTIVSDQKQE